MTSNQRPVVLIHYVDPDVPISLQTACGLDLAEVASVTDWMPGVSCDGCFDAGSLPETEATP